MVAEDSKDVKEKRDREAVKGVDEKGRHDDRASWNYVGPYTKILYAVCGLFPQGDKTLPIQSNGSSASND